QRIEPEFETRRRKTNQVVHDQRHPAKERLQIRALFLFFRRENLPLQNCRLPIFDLRFHTARIANRNSEIVSPEYPSASLCSSGISSRTLTGAESPLPVCDR